MNPLDRRFLNLIYGFVDDYRVIENAIGLGWLSQQWEELGSLDDWRSRML